MASGNQQAGSRDLPQDARTFFRIRKWYLIAVAAIAVSIVASQILIQRHLASQLDDSKVINVAGRQRALSQKLSKEVLLLGSAEAGTPARLEELDSLRATLELWQVSHNGLLAGNDSIGLPGETNPEIRELFSRLQADFDAMVKAAEYLVNHPGIPADGTDFTRQQRIVLEHEPSFLARMDEIVNWYDRRSKERLEELRFKEYLLLALALAILMLEILFIFRPLARHVREIIGDLMHSKSESEGHLQKVNRLYAEMESSMKELQELNYVLNTAALFASIRSDGSIISISRKFLSLLDLEEIPQNASFAEVLTSEPGQQQYLRELLGAKRKIIRTEEIEVTTVSGNTLWLDMSVAPFHEIGLKQSILILCSDITERKKTQQKVEDLAHQHYEERIQLRQLRASQVVEGQEEERKRIAKDIHDGIGQMLTALKFNIESINPENVAKTQEKIEYLKVLAADLIKGVRTATFNLTPPELSDHGLFPALHKMATELSKLTGKNILFEQKADLPMRLDSLAETNIYRVTQEAVNNAIKYSEAELIRISVNRNKQLLSVVVADNGKGFDPAKLATAPANASAGGMGIFFMRERIRFINGRLFIDAAPGEGARVVINYNLDNTVD